MNTPLDPAADELARSFGIATAERMYRSLRQIADVVLAAEQFTYVLDACDHAYGHDALRRCSDEIHLARTAVRNTLSALNDDDRRLLGLDR